MVKNREELIQVANSNANQMKTHLRNAVSGFLKEMRVKPQDLAYVLGITNDEMAQILEGDGNVTVDTLSKLLVATDLVVEIKPIRNTPLGGYGKGMPRSGGFPGPNGIPVDENGRPLPPPPGFPRDFMPGMPGMFGRPNREERAADMREEVPMEAPVSASPARDEHGRFIKKGTAHRRPAAQRPEQRNDNPYASMPDAELTNIIRSNIWDGEIDVNRASHDELAAFVANKERIMRERQNPPVEEKRNPNVDSAKAPNIGGGSDTLNQFLGMLGNIAREAQNNPQLMETISRFMPK
jgi:hypothetical protein